jgi:hypothetical protein
MDNLHLLLIGAVVGLVVAMSMLGRAQVVIAPEPTREGTDRFGCGGMLVGALVLALMVLYLSQA